MPCISTFKQKKKTDPSPTKYALNVFFFVDVVLCYGLQNEGMLHLECALCWFMAYGTTNVTLRLGLALCGSQNEKNFTINPYQSILRTVTTMHTDRTDRTN